MTSESLRQCYWLVCWAILEYLQTLLIGFISCLKFEEQGMVLKFAKSSVSFFERTLEEHCALRHFLCCLYYLFLYASEGDCISSSSASFIIVNLYYNLSSVIRSSCLEIKVGGTLKKWWNGSWPMWWQTTLRYNATFREETKRLASDRLECLTSFTVRHFLVNWLLA